jgi:hypothetical protein
VREERIPGIAGILSTREKSRASQIVFLLVWFLLTALTGCAPKQRCVKTFLFVDYPNGQPDTVYASHCRFFNAP